MLQFSLFSESGVLSLMLYTLLFFSFFYLSCWRSPFYNLLLEVLMVVGDLYTFTIQRSNYDWERFFVKEWCFKTLLRQRTAMSGIFEFVILQFSAIPWIKGGGIRTCVEGEALTRAITWLCVVLRCDCISCALSLLSWKLTILYALL